MNRAWKRWVPAAAVPAVIAAGVLAGSIPARAGDPLPQKSPAEVLTLLGQHSTRTFSGTLEQVSELGLPDLPAGAPTSGPVSAGGPASIIELLTGEHTARIFMDGPAKVRVQVMDRLAERDVIRRDHDVWFYNSKDNSAAHLTLPAVASDLPLRVPESPGVQPRQNGSGDNGSGQDGSAPDQPTRAFPTPDDLAATFLAKVDSSTAVTVGPDVQVAGRSAYSLELAPRTDGTLLAKVVIAVDGQNGMPLRVTVSARGQAQPAFEAGFTSLSLTAPEDATFNFAAPPGATLKELPASPLPAMPALPGKPGEKAPGQSPDQGPDHVPGDASELRHHDGTQPTVTGEGWETVVGFPAAPDGQGAQLSETVLKDPLLSQAAVVVPGGRLLSTSLVNVLLTDDGRVFVGMVPAERLQAAAGAA
jgi:outer membrane lipoprotein-sorting protein